MAMGIELPEVIGITGSKGFIGSHLLKKLQKENVPFVAFQGDLLKVEDVKKFFSNNKITTVIHLVGGMNEPFGGLLKTNVLTTQKLLEIGVQNSLKKIIFTSTGAVYGNKKKKLAQESDVPEPTTLYGLSKLFAEKVVNLYERDNGVVGIILRFPNIYGNDNEKNVIAKMLFSIKKEKKVYISGDGEQRRQFLHVDDAVEAIKLSLKLTKSETLNITNEDDEYSINELSQILKKNFSFDIEKAPSGNNLKNLLMRGGKAEKIIGFKAKNSLADFLKNLL